MPTCTQCGSRITAADGVCPRCEAFTYDDGPRSRPSVSQPALGETAGAPGYSQASSQSIATLIPQWGQVTRRGWWLLGGALLVFIGSLLPWVQQSVDGYSTVSAHPGGGGVMIFLVLALAAVAAGWPLLAGGLSRRRLVGMSIVAALLAFFAVTNWSDLNSVQKQAAGLGGGLATVSVSAGSGLMLYTAGVLVLSTLTARLWLSRRHRAQGGAGS